VAILRDGSQVYANAARDHRASPISSEDCWIVLLEPVAVALSLAAPEGLSPSGRRSLCGIMVITDTDRGDLAEGGVKLAEVDADRPTAEFVASDRAIRNSASNGLGTHPGVFGRGIDGNEAALCFGEQSGGHEKALREVAL